MIFQVNRHHISSLVRKNWSKPAPSLATSSSSADVQAEAMASGSFRMKGNTSLRGKGLEIKEQKEGKGWDLDKLNPKSMRVTARNARSPLFFPKYVEVKGVVFSIPGGTDGKIILSNELTCWCSRKPPDGTGQQNSGPNPPEKKLQEHKHIRQVITQCGQEVNWYKIS